MDNYWIFIVLFLPGTYAVRNETELRIETMQNQLKEMKEVLERQRLTITRLKTNLDNTEHNVQELTGYQKGKRASTNTSSVVGFTATINKKNTNLRNKQTIVYDTALTNVHHGYNKTSGIFTCPLSGQYQFAASIIASYDHKRADAELVKDGVPLIHLSAHGLGYDCGARVIMTHCNKNQRVWVRHVTTQHGSNQIGFGAKSYFSGHLIQAD